MRGSRGKIQTFKFTVIHLVPQNKIIPHAPPGNPCMRGALHL